MLDNTKKKEFSDIDRGKQYDVTVGSRVSVNRYGPGYL